MDAVRTLLDRSRPQSWATAFLMTAIGIFAMNFLGSQTLNQSHSEQIQISKMIECVSDIAIQPESQPDEEGVSGSTQLSTKGHREFVRQELGDLSSPFTRETVLELNAIVRRSLSAIQSFDRMRQTSGQDPQRRFEQLGSFRQIAADAKVAMNRASQRLRRSGERYNEEILTAMICFVDRVELEIGEEAKRYSVPASVN